MTKVGKGAEMKTSICIESTLEWAYLWRASRRAKEKRQRRTAGSEFVDSRKHSRVLLNSPGGFVKGHDFSRAAQRHNTAGL